MIVMTITDDHVYYMLHIYVYMYIYIEGNMRLEKK